MLKSESMATKKKKRKVKRGKKEEVRTQANFLKMKIRAKSGKKKKKKVKGGKE